MGDEAEYLSNDEYYYERDFGYRPPFRPVVRSYLITSTVEHGQKIYRCGRCNRKVKDITSPRCGWCKSKLTGGLR